jgi:hypothetical protein
MSSHAHNFRTINCIIYPNSTKTFKNLLLKYQKMKKGKSLNNKFFLKSIHKKIQKLDYQEPENDYIYKEIKKDLEIKKRILNAFGTKALYHLDEIKNINVPIKMEKSKFFNHMKDFQENNNSTSDQQNHEIKKSLNNGKNKHIYNSHKIIYFPKIIKTRNGKNSQSKNLFKTLSLMKNTSSSFGNKNDIPENEKNEKNENNKNIQNIKSILGYCNTTNEFNSPSSPNILKNNFNKTLTEKNQNNKDIPINNSTFRRRKFKINKNCFNDLKDIKEKLIWERKKQKKYFENNKYGCDIYKLKYNYLKTKYFD